MTTLTDDLAREAARLGELLGDGSATLTVPHTLALRGAAAPVSSLVLSGTHTATRTITLRSSATVKLVGLIPAGLVLTIDGVGYTASADATASGTTVVVTVNSALASGSDGDAATLGSGVTSTYPNASIDVVGEEQIPMALIGEANWTPFLPRYGAPGTPKLNDYVTLDGRKGRIVGFWQKDPAGWGCFCS